MIIYWLLFLGENMWRHERPCYLVGIRLERSKKTFMCHTFDINHCECVQDLKRLVDLLSRVRVPLTDLGQISSVFHTLQK